MLLYYKVIIAAFDVEVIALEFTYFIQSVFKSSWCTEHAWLSTSATGGDGMHPGFLDTFDSSAWMIHSQLGELGIRLEVLPLDHFSHTPFHL